MTPLKTLSHLEEIQQNLNKVREHCRNRNLEKAMATECLRTKDKIEKSIKANSSGIIY